jgi:hypothetical protein
VKFSAKNVFGRSSRLRRCGWAPGKTHPGPGDGQVTLDAETFVLSVQGFKLIEERRAGAEVGEEAHGGATAVSRDVRRARW